MKKILIFICIGVVIGLVIIITCRPDEKDRVKKDIKALARAVEKEDKQAILLYIDSTYTDRRGSDFAQFTANIDDLLDMADTIKIHMSGLKINIDSTDAHDVFFASCSLNLKITAKYQGERALVYGGLVKPSPVQALFKKTGEHYRVYYAQY
jgi:hypothetical protein